MRIVNLPLNLDLTTFSALTPNRDSDGVLSAVIKHAGRNRERDLVADVRIESTVLVAVDEEKNADAVAVALLGGREGRVGGGGELE